MRDFHRETQRKQAFLDRGGYYVALCDLCGDNKAQEYHEILSRGRTVKNEEARYLSYDKHICSCLCSHCHREGVGAHNPKVATALLRRNVKLYGYEAVKSAFDRALDSMNTIVNIEFPEVNYERT